MKTISLSKFQIEKQYYHANLFEEICERLDWQDIGLNSITRSDISGVDEFHVRGAEVSNELVEEIYLKNCKVLDVGCGLGGPARMLADRFNCHVTGIDLCAEYIRTAKKLSELTGLTKSTKFIHGDALNLPFEDGSFDIVWTQHAQMNVADKTKFYSEIKRVLTDEGTIVFYDIFTRNGADIQYPVPWANNASLSFLQTISNMERLLNDLGFRKLQTSNQSDKAKQFLTGLFEKIKKNGPPKLGLNVLMGASTKEKLTNILKGLEEDKLELHSGIYRI